LIESKSLRLFRQNFQRQFVGGAHSLISIHGRSIAPFEPRVGCGFFIAAFVSLVASRLANPAHDGIETHGGAAMRVKARLHRLPHGLADSDRGIRELE